jgi:hypothetical protein
MRRTRRTILIIAIGAGSLAAPATSSMALRDHRLELCDRGNTDNPLPAVAELGHSSGYPHGARTCSWTGKRRVAYSCRGGSAPPRLGLVESHEVPGGRQRLFPFRCDGRVRKLGPAAYSGLSGRRFHLHLYSWRAVWTSAWLRVY